MNFNRLLLLCATSFLVICGMFQAGLQAGSRHASADSRPKQNSETKALSIAEPQKRPAMELAFLSESPVIDGVLDDAAWKKEPLPLGEWLTYNPAYGETMIQKTRAWVAYDKSYLFLAFRCEDPEPEKIKTSIARRDTIWNDDWIGISLDALGAGQSSYDLFVNPSGIQGDILTSSTAGEDTAPDWVWHSAGRITAEGYEVEMRIPLKSIRFKSGVDVRMGIIFWRRVSRLGMSASWPDLPRGRSVFTRHAPLLMHDLKQPLTLEAIPNVTYSLRQTRSTPESWGNTDSKPDAGLTVKYGITSSVTLDGTIRPDFSQVESDAFQVLVNQRYPVFYSEKRPFFMEGMGTFELAGTGGDGNMRTAVHTRRIIDPLYGMKLTGSIGKLTFATLSASDRGPGELDSSDPLAGERKAINIGRALYSLGKGSYVGGLFTDTEFGGGHNRVAAGDVSIQIGDHQHWTTTVIGTQTLAPSQSEGRKGVAAQSSYFYESKRYEAGGQFEHYDRDFQMDTGFYNRTGITGGWTYGAINLFPDQERFKWFKRTNLFIFNRGYRDRIQDGHDFINVTGVRMYFTRQGFFRIHQVTGRETWARQLFPIRSTEIQGGAQLMRWLNVQGNMSISRSIYYDPEDPFSGNERYGSITVTLQPDSKLNQKISFTRDVFDRLMQAGRVYSVNIINSRTNYQINERFALRAIVQYDSSRTRVLTDFLGSYELVPGTVAYAGYGALYEKQSWDGQEFTKGSGAYLNTERGLFFKVSYLHRF